MNESLRASAVNGAIETDALIIGAGPVGIFQAFQLGLLEISAHIVDALPHPGGQCVELYADKPIYDIPGVPVCTGRELIDNLLTQVIPFKPQWHLGQLVSTIQRQADGRLHVTTHLGRQFLTKTIFIAAGVGAFQARMPNLPGLAAHVGLQLHLALPEGSEWSARKVLILGDTDAALNAAIALVASQGAPLTVTLMHRRNAFVADPSTIDRFQSLVEARRIEFVAGQATSIEVEDGRITALGYLSSEGVQRAMPVDEILILQGLSPKLGPVAHWGLDMERRQIKVNTADFATDQAGIFAVGDINTYPGKKKLILCGFHECVLAAFGAAAIIAPNKSTLLQYTTTSTRLHTLLGVDTLAPVIDHKKIKL